jgi:hypothetical protein
MLSIPAGRGSRPLRRRWRRRSRDLGRPGWRRGGKPQRPLRDGCATALTSSRCAHTVECCSSTDSALCSPGFAPGWQPFSRKPARGDGKEALLRQLSVKPNRRGVQPTRAHLGVGPPLNDGCGARAEGDRCWRAPAVQARLVAPVNTACVPIALRVCISHVMPFEVTARRGRATQRALGRAARGRTRHLVS